jgi:hypothetical protein
MKYLTKRVAEESMIMRQMRSEFVLEDSLERFVENTNDYRV